MLSKFLCAISVFVATSTARMMFQQKAQKYRIHALETALYNLNGLRSGTLSKVVAAKQHHDFIGVDELAGHECMLAERDLKWRR